ncbi:type III-A CRISPR-associated protein Cas10/Csm1 [Cuniculiplasma sp. SKW4]|uniref:type III-A CRISPR-associated protein Cas10/Csm1 n=1 Tax=Cuniculiplasma sp. SKW4 TaxID=3400171 RepID=UPI003FD0E11F
METSEDEKVLILASLLHDLGKIRVRHDSGKRHAEHGYDMVQEIMKSNPNRNYMDRVSKLVKHHHDQYGLDDLDEKDRELLEILKDSDRKSAAHEREDRDGQVQNDGPKLTKISTYLSLGKKFEKNSTGAFPIATEEEVLEDPINFGRSTSTNYRIIDKKTVEEISRLNTDNFENFINSVNSILRNTTSYIPSAFFYSNPNIPLYDHLKVTAAIAMCRYRSKLSNNNKFILIKTDLSGIQNYIFRYFRSEQADDKGTKRIRGRSLRVSMTTRVIVQYILDELNLFDINVMWLNSDGALIMAPYSDENEQKLEEIRREVSRFFIEHDRGIWCAIDWQVGDYEIIPAVKNERNEKNGDLEIDDTDFRKFLDSLMEKLNRVKRAPFSDFIRSQYSEFFGGEITDPCWACGLNPKKSDEKCEECLTEEIIGQKIMKTDDQITMIGGYGGDISFKIGERIYSFFLGEIKPMANGEIRRIIYLNKLPDRMKDYGVPWEIFLTGNFAPMNEGNLKTFEDILKIGKRKNGREYFYMGIYKADLDNMGTLISEGFPKLTMPAYAAFSRQTTTFFTQAINSIAMDSNVYLVYSGGDDVSALGSLLDVVEFSKRLQTEFKKWFENDEITLSSGIATTHAKFPTRRGIDIAEEALEMSKMNGKDSITVFETTMKNSTFADRMYGLGQELKNVTDKMAGQLGISFLQLLLKLDDKNPYVKSPSRGSEIFFPDHYLYYYIERNWKGEEKEKQDLLREIVKEDVFRFIRYPATWAIMKKRQEAMQIGE